jgi:carbamoyltransferase
MESGPRALGNRSILMSPSKAENKDIINSRVKFREAFRPFCPSMPEEAAPEYIERPRPEPFMITSFDVKSAKAGRIPAVVHRDQTLRPQTVSKKINPRYWNLLSEFGKRTGAPVLLNTSFNIKGEPMICSPREAIRGFFDSGIDLLVMGNVVVEKEKPSDAFCSFVALPNRRPAAHRPCASASSDWVICPDTMARDFAAASALMAISLPDRGEP